jgi:5-methyltetrahydrofolate--homocysteine methyltransferase
MPIGAMGTAGRQVFRLLRRLREELGVNTTCGASNISFGLPNRKGIDGAFLAMAIANGMTSAITSPLHEEVRQAVMAADVLMGADAHAAAWIARYRDGGGGAPAVARGARRGGRAARHAAGADAPTS